MLRDHFDSTKAAYWRVKQVNLQGQGCSRCGDLHHNSRLQTRDLVPGVRAGARRGIVRAFYPTSAAAITVAGVAFAVTALPGCCATSVDL